MHRSLLSAALFSGVLLTAVPLTGLAGAAACPSWTDPAGDAGLGPAGDDSVDITAVKVEQTAAAMVTTFTVPDLGNVNQYTFGDRFLLELTAGGTTATVYSDRDDVDLAPSTGVIVGDSASNGGTVTYDVPGKKVVLTMPYAVFTDALGKPFAGLPLAAFEARVDAQQSAAGGSLSYATFDTAAAPAGTGMTGAVACGAGGGPVTPPAPPKPAVPVITTGPVPTDLPKAGCFTKADDKGDAKPFNSNVPNDPDVDITGVTYRSTHDWFLTYLKVDALGASPQLADGHRFSIDFTFNKHTFTVAGSAYKNAQSQSIREGIASTGFGGKMVQMSVDAMNTISAGTAVAYAEGQVEPPFVDSGSKAFFDTKNSVVTIAVPVADIQKYGQAQFAGATLENVLAKSTLDYYRNSFQADSTAAANATSSTEKWLTGDNKCFAASTKMALTVAKAASKRTVTAKLTTANGSPVGAKDVVFFLNGKKASTVKTAANGTAVLGNVKPGTTVKAVFTAAGGYLASSATKKA